MILMPQIFDVTANENARYKRNELECILNAKTFKVLMTSEIAAYKESDKNCNVDQYLPMHNLSTTINYMDESRDNAGMLHSA